MVPRIAQDLAQLTDCLLNKQMDFSSSSASSHQCYLCEQTPLGLAGNTYHCGAEIYEGSDALELFLSF
jgi:hypothetical protein